MGAFGSASLGTKFSIVLVCLVGLSFGAGLIKLWINKRRLKKHIKLEEEQLAGKAQDTEKLVGRKLDEGDLFGVRALEYGYFGGVAQSRSSSPTPAHTIAPSATLPNREEIGQSLVQHSVTDLHQTQSSTISMPTNPQPIKNKPLLLGLQPSDAEFNRRMAYGQLSSNPESVDSLAPSTSPKLGVYTPTSGVLSATEFLSVNVHSDSAPQTNSKRPKSYLPKLGFINDLENNGLVTSSLLGTIRRKKPELTSVSRDDAPVTFPVEEAEAKSADYSAFPSPPIPSRAARQSQRSIFPRSDDMDRPASRRSGKSINLADIPIPPVPMTYDSSSFTTRSLELPELQDSLNSNNNLSAYRPIRSRSGSRETTGTTRDRAPSVAASSVYSAASSILEFAPDEVSSAQQHTHTRSRSDSSQRVGRSRNVSHSHKRQSSSKSLSRTRDSLKRHRQKVSEDQTTRKGMNEDRDQILHDPLSQYRNRSGSTQSRTVDISDPSDSHFPYPTTTSTQSVTSNSFTASSTSASTSKRADLKIQMKSSYDPRLLDLYLPQGDSDSLSMSLFNTEANSASRARRASVQDRSSRGSFNGSYATQSIANRRSRSQSREPPVSNSGIGVAVTGRRPRPLKAVAGPFRAAETIVEMPTPLPTPVVKGYSGNSVRAG